MVEVFTVGEITLEFGLKLIFLLYIGFRESDNCFFVTFGGSRLGIASLSIGIAPLGMETYPFLKNYSDSTFIISSSL